MPVPPHAGASADDQADHLRRVTASLRRPWYSKAFARTARISHAPALARVERARAPAVVVMGEADPDVADPAGEAAWVRGALGGRVVMVPEVGHCPHSQQPEMVGQAVLEFLAEVAPRA
jgi:pimeloyl-ACP methyl ester carboxylesterase